MYFNTVGDCIARLQQCNFCTHNGKRLVTRNQVLFLSAEEPIYCPGTVYYLSANVYANSPRSARWFHLSLRNRTESEEGFPLSGSTTPVRLRSYFFLSPYETFSVLSTTRCKRTPYLTVMNTKVRGVN